MSKALICPNTNVPCEYEGYCAITKSLLAPGTSYTQARDTLLDEIPADDLISRSRAERIHGYCSEDKIAAAEESLADPMNSELGRIASRFTIENTLSKREQYGNR